ncbi:MAG: CpXC domain-containing protein [Planctomycetota bacterium]|nr:CpXC domain-containing protein [Planctomycetota bacterium]
MSSSSKQIIACPACQHKQDFELWHSVNVTLDPTLRDRLRSGALTTFRCGNCGHAAEVVSPLLYHDMEKHWMFWLVPDGKLPQNVDVNVLNEHLQNYRLRLVRSRNELVEKLNTFAAGFDDRVVAVLKFFLRAQLERQNGIENASLFFHERLKSETGTEHLCFAWVNDDKVRAIGISVELYESTQADLQSVLEGPLGREDAWLLADDHFVTKLLGQRKP